MTSARALAVALLVITGIALQSSVINLMGLPIGQPQLPLLILAVVALVEGPGVGSVAGFATGLSSDALSVHPLGQQALVLTLVGWFVGAVRQDGDRSVVVPLVAVLTATGVALVACAGLGFLVGGPGVRPGVLALEVVAAVAYAALLTPVLLPPIRTLLVRLDPERRRL